MGSVARANAIASLSAALKNGPQSVAELASATGLSRSSTSRWLNKMETTRRAVRLGRGIWGPYE